MTTPAREYCLFIYGQWVRTGSLQEIKNKYTGEAVGALPVARREDVESDYALHPLMGHRRHPTWCSSPNSDLRIHRSTPREVRPDAQPNVVGLSSVPAEPIPASHASRSSSWAPRQASRRIG